MDEQREGCPSMIGHDRSQDSTVEVDVGPVNPDVSRVHLGSGEHDIPRDDLGPRVAQDHDMDERLIATYERGHRAERRDLEPVVHMGTSEEFRRLFDSFMRLCPPHFDGTGGYSAAEEWLANIKAKLNLCRASEEDRVELAKQQLESDARFWLDGVWRSCRGGGQRIPWIWFEQHFTQRFLSKLH